ncbi:MAG: vitamin K epoxide reductase family protein [Limnochordales bacterium]|nr:MAG: vitamin K epoxide reductase [Bacillota bacterium]
MSLSKPWRLPAAERRTEKPEGDAGGGTGRRAAASAAEAAADRAGEARWPLPLAGLSLGGAGLSAYLWQAKVGGTELICGPLGDCVTVNASVFSEVMGVPVALLGMLMYLALAGVLLVVWRRPDSGLANYGFALALAGTLFSLYLTGLEAFVIGAYCVWCLTSWILITGITWQWGRMLRRTARNAH